MYACIFTWQVMHYSAIQTTVRLLDIYIYIYIYKFVYYEFCYVLYNPHCVRTLTMMLTPPSGRVTKQGLCEIKRGRCYADARLMLPIGLHMPCSRTAMGLRTLYLPYTHSSFTICHLLIYRIINH